MARNDSNIRAPSLRGAIATWQSFKATEITALPLIAMEGMYAEKAGAFSVAMTQFLLLLQ